MKVKLLAIGKTADKTMLSAVERYVSRLGHYVRFEFIAIDDVKTAKSMTEDKQKELECEKMLTRIAPSDYLILLDERGRIRTSRDFACHLQELMMKAQHDVVFAIGGPFGFAPKMYARANEQLSLTPMTLTHEMVRLFFIEQLYRAMTIMRGEPYHHD